MPWLGALLLASGLVAATGDVSAAVYVPGQYRDGIYTRPHFLASPDARYDRNLKLDGAPGGLPKPTVIDEPLPPKKLPPESPS